METMGQLKTDTIWLLTSGGTADLRQQLFDAVHAQGFTQVLDRREFARVTTYHLQRPHPDR